MSYGIVYRAFCTVTGKSYVGQTRARLEGYRSRRSAHEYNATHGKGHAFSAALRKYGPENFVWSTVATINTGQEELDAAEVYFGTFFDALVPNGYSLKLGQARGLSSVAFIENNRKAQLIAQNRPKVKAKTSKTVKGWWAERSDEERKARAKHMRTNLNRNRSVVCLNDGLLFKNAGEAGKNYGVSRSSVKSIAGGYAKETRSGLSFVFEDSAINQEG